MIVRTMQLSIFLIIILFASTSVDALEHRESRLRGQTNRSLKKKKKWGGQVSVSSLENDDPEAYLALQAAKGVLKGHKGKKSDENDDDDDDEDDSSDEDYERPASKGSKVETAQQCDDPEDPSCNPELSETTDFILGDAQDPADEPITEEEAEAIEAVEEIEEETPMTTVAETMDREVTPFKLAFSLSKPLDDGELDDGDYAELSDNTKLHLTEYFQSYFEDEPTNFYEIIVRLQKTGDALVCRFYVTASFVIPGNVPTMANLFDRMEDVFAGEEAESYVTLLNGMGSGNPFRNTESIALINETPSAATGDGQSNSGSPKVSENPKQILPIIIGSCILAFVIAGFMWVRREIKHAQLELDECENQEEVTAIKPTHKETQKYLDVIRQHYEEDASKTDLEDASIEGGDDDTSNGADDEATQATDNRQTVTELRELRDAMEQIDLLAQSHPDYQNQLTMPSPPSQEFEDEDLDNASSVAPFDEPKSKARDARNEHYMKYLDIVSASFDDDLRG